jgi:hypothetical protein
MFGLEKKGKALFEFDLEKELKADHAKCKELLKATEGKILEIKNSLRQGSASEEFDQKGVLLNGLVALQRVLTRIANKK